MDLSLSRRRVFALLISTCLLLITLDVRGNPTIEAAKRMFGSVLAPLESAGRAASRPIRDAWRGATAYRELERENDRLRQQVEQMQGESIAAQVALRDYQELLAADQLTSLSQYSRVTAQVLAYAPQNFQQTVEINQGSKRGIRVGMPVVNAAGLVGKVTSVTPESAIVLLISDPTYSVTVKVVGSAAIPGTEEVPFTIPSGDPAPVTSEAPLTSFDPLAVADSVPDSLVPDSSAPATLSQDEALAAASASSSSLVETTTTVPATTTTVDLSDLQRRELGALQGRGGDKFPIVRFLNNDRFTRAIQAGDLVATNGGTTSLAPADLVVGTVERVQQRAGSGGPVVEVRPAADLRQLNFVRVVLYIPPIESAGG